MNHITYTVGADTRSFDATLQRSISRVAQPLGRIVGSSSEFTKSLEASNARVLAFGASAASIYAIKRAFDFTIQSVVDVEKSLADINSLLRLSSGQLEKFGADLFAVAGNTASSFNDVAKAATEFSRQGLGVAETLQRTEVAMGLTRLSGLELSESISAVTAAMNTFNKEGLTAIQFADKLATVDAAFAVSSADLAQAIKRVGSVAEDSNVSLNQMLALTAATQQKTARGGAIIGNAFKTIFTRLNRPEVLNQLESLGLKTRDVTGQIRPLMDIMRDLALRYDTLAPAAKSVTSELLGGVFQINILKAAMSDLGSGFSVYDSALKMANQSSGEFNRRNQELNKTISARTAQIINDAQQVAATVGNIAFKPVLSGGLDLLQGGLKDIKDVFTVDVKFNAETNEIEKTFMGLGGKLGNELANGFVGVIGGIISGPFIQILATIATKLSIGFISFTRDSAMGLLGMNQNADLYKKTLEQTKAILAHHPELLQQIKNGTMTVQDVQNGVLQTLIAQNKSLKEQEILASRIAGIRIGALNQSGTPVSQGIISTTIQNIGTKFKTKASGHTPREFLIEELKARSLGASDSVKAKWSKGTIDGQRFVMNNQEVEIPGAGKNGDSLVIPRYGRKTSGFAQGFAPGSMDIGGSLMLGMLSGMSSSFGKGKSKEIERTEKELEGFRNALKQSREVLQKNKSDFKSSSLSLSKQRDAAFSKGDLEKYEWNSRVDDDKRAQLKDLEEAKSVRMSNLRAQAKANLAPHNQDLARANMEVGVRTSSISRLRSFQTSNENVVQSRIGNLKSGQASQEAEVMERLKRNNEAIAERNKKSHEDALNFKTQKESEFNAQQQTSEGKISSAKRVIDRIKKGGGNSYEKLTPERKADIAAQESLIAQENQKILELAKKRFALEKRTQEKKSTFDEISLKATQEEGRKAQEKLAAIKTSFSQKIQTENNSLAKIKSIFGKQIEAEQEKLAAAEKSKLFAQQAKGQVIAQHKTDSKNIREEFGAKSQAIVQSSTKRKDSITQQIEARTLKQLDSINAQVLTLEQENKEKRDSLARSIRAERREVRAREKTIQVLEKEAEQKAVASQRLQGKAFGASFALSGLAGSGIVGKTVGSGAIGDTAQAATENAAMSAQIVSALPNQYGMLAAAIAFLGKTVYDGAIAFDTVNTKKLETDLETFRTRASIVSGRLTEYAQTVGTLSSSYGDANVSVKQLIEMQNKASKMFGDLPKEVRAKLLAASSSEEKNAVIAQYQSGMAAEEKQKSANLDLDKRFSDANKSNMLADVLNPINLIPGGTMANAMTGGWLGKKLMGENRRSGVFDTRGPLGNQTEAEKKKDEEDAKNFASFVNSSMSSSETTKALAVFGSTQGKTSQEQVAALGAAGVLTGDQSAKVGSSKEGSKRFMENFKQQVIDSEAARMSQEALTESSKGYQKQIYYINKELEILRESSQSVYASMNADVTSYIKSLTSASKNLLKLANAKRTGQVEDSQAREELAGMKYGAGTMNSIKFQNKRAEILVETGNKEAEAKNKASEDIVGVIMSKVLSNSNSIFKNQDGSSNVSKEALFAKGALAQIVSTEFGKNPSSSPETLFKNIETAIDALPVNNNLGNETKNALGKDFSPQEIAQNIENANKAMKLELKSSFAGGSGQSEAKAIIDTLKEQLDSDKTNAKIQIDAFNRQEKNQRELIQFQKNSKMFGGLPSTRKEERDLERQIRKDSSRAAKGDPYAQNRLLKLASDNFGDDLSEDSVKGLKDKVKKGESERIQKLVGLFGQSGLISGLPQKYNQARTKQIASDKVDNLLKTEAGKGFNAEKFVNQSFDKQLILSNASLKTALNSLEQTFKNRFGAANSPVPQSAVDDAAKKQAELKAAEARAKTERKEIDAKRKEEIEQIQKGFKEALTRGLKIDSITGKVSFEIQNASTIAPEIVNAVKSGLDKLIEDQINIKMGVRAGDPARVTRI